MTATLTLALNLMAAPEFVRVRLHAGQKPFALQGQVVCGAQTVKNPKVRSAGSLWLVGSAKLTKTANCAGKGRFQFGDVRWRGEARLNRRGKTLQLVAVLDMESYVAGVVNAEVLPGWPPASLKAMAVAARTYTHWRRASRRQADWDVTADVSSQVYRGGDARRPVLRAVSATRGQILLFGGKPAATYYHACAAGRTVPAQEVWGRDYPYLQSVISPDLACNRVNWDSRLSTDDAGQRLGLGKLVQAKIISFQPSGRVKQIRFWGRSGKKDFNVQDVRKKLGWDVVRSSDFRVSVADGKILVLRGHGSGHGVGMSQWGARGLALKGKNYTEILQHFYPGTTFRK
ncbi:MAG: hypothetical protein CMH50_00815 [Myxococcales bacterium]|nr:hypothetical protein [Myxococcales bacterium]